LALCRYVVLNPVRAGLVPHPRAWRWSSYGATAGEQAVPWLRVAWGLGHFARERRQAQRTYRRFVADGRASPERPWIHLRSQIYLGSEAFLQEIHPRLGAVRTHATAQAGMVPGATAGGRSGAGADAKQPSRPQL
jgi:hypothetical protein